MFKIGDILKAGPTNFPIALYRVTKLNPDKLPYEVEVAWVKEDCTHHAPVGHKMYGDYLAGVSWVQVKGFVPPKPTSKHPYTSIFL